MNCHEILHGVAERLRAVGLEPEDGSTSHDLWIEEHGYRTESEKRGFLDNPGIRVWCTSDKKGMIEIVINCYPVGARGLNWGVVQEPFDKTAGTERVADLIIKSRGLFLELDRAEGANLWPSARKFEAAEVGFLPTLLDLLWLSPSHVSAYATRCSMRLSRVIDLYAAPDEKEQALYRAIDWDAVQIVRGTGTPDRLLSDAYPKAIYDDSDVADDGGFPMSEATRYRRIRKISNKQMWMVFSQLDDYHRKMSGHYFFRFLAVAAEMGALTLLRDTPAELGLRESLRMAALRDFNNLKEHSSSISSETAIAIECDEDGFLSSLL